MYIADFPNFVKFCVKPTPKKTKFFKILSDKSNVVVSLHVSLFNMALKTLCTYLFIKLALMMLLHAIF